MQIYGPSHVHGPQPINPPHHGRSAPGGNVGNAGVVQDELQISDTGRLIEQVHNLPEIRSDRVEQLRTALANGTYDIDGKLEAALDRLLDDVA